MYMRCQKSYRKMDKLFQLGNQGTVQDSRHPTSLSMFQEGMVFYYIPNCHYLIFMGNKIQSGIIKLRSYQNWDSIYLFHI